MGTTLDYLAWAQAYVDQLDPLTSAVRHEDYEKPANEYGNDDEKWKKGLARLVGAPWKDAWKVGQECMPPPRRPNDYWYSTREKSVFEVGAAPESESDDE